MARIKTYYTTDETINSLYTFGGEYMTTDRIEYKGPYHRYTTTSEVYTESKWDLRLSKKLIPFVHEDTIVATYKNIKNIQVAKQEPKTIVPVIDKQSLLNGSIDRYFIKKINQSTIIEIDQQQYNDWVSQKIDRVLYQAVGLTWYISGPQRDTIKTNTTIYGTITKNRQSVTQAALIIPELITHLSNLTEYYTDNEFIIPIDINGLDS